jgi:phosphate-selective porin
MRAIRGLRIHCVGLLAGFALGAAPVAAAEGDVDKRMDALEKELEALKKDVADKDSGDAAPAGSKASKDMNLMPTWQVTDGITFKPGFRVQGQYRYGDVSDHVFRIRRFRMKGSGKLFGIAKYGAELRVDGTGNTRIPNPNGSTANIGVENAWVEFTKLKDVKARFGLYDIPFSRSNLTSDSKLLFQDRSIIRGLLSGVGLSDNTIGALFHGRPFGGKLEYATGVFQNDNFKQLPTTSARLVLNLLDPPKQGGYADYRGSYIGEGRRLAISANGAYTPNVTDPNTALPGGAGLNYDLYAFGSDIFFNTGPFTVQAEYDWFTKDTGSTGPAGGADYVTHGGYVQAGLLLGPVFGVEEGSRSSILNSIELAARYQDADDETPITVGTVTRPRGRAQWIAAGLNYYIRSHNLKVQTDYTFKDSNFFGSSDRHLFQLQLQLDF